MLATQTVVGSSPEPLPMRADMSAGMWTSIQSAGVTPEVNLRITQVRKHTKGINPGLESQGRCHPKSKTGVSVAPRILATVILIFCYPGFILSQIRIYCVNLLFTNIYSYFHIPSVLEDVCARR